MLLQKPPTAFFTLSLVGFWNKHFAVGGYWNKLFAVGGLLEQPGIKFEVSF